MEIHSACGATGAGDVTWPSANLAIYVPMYLPSPLQLQSLYWNNGTTVAGNVMMGIYNENGSQILETAVVAQSGSGAPQSVDFSSRALRFGTGRYWLGIVMSSATAQLKGWTNGTGITSINRMFGLSEESLGGTDLPAQMTFGSSARGLIPLLGIGPAGIAL